MPRARRLLPALVVAVAVTGLAALGCARSKPSPTLVSATPAAIVEAETLPEDSGTPSAEGSCTQMLARFGPEVARAQLDACVAATSTSPTYTLCEEAGLLDEYLSCFAGCMGGIAVDDPVDNCEPGCGQTTCE